MKKIMNSLLIVSTIMIFAQPEEESVFDVTLRKVGFGRIGFCEARISWKSIPGLTEDSQVDITKSTGEKLKQFFEQQVTSRLKCLRIGDQVLVNPNYNRICSQNFGSLQSVVVEICEQQRSQFKSFGQDVKEQKLMMFSMNKNMKIKDITIEANQSALIPLPIKILSYVVDDGCSISDEMLGLIAASLLRKNTTTEYHGVGYSLKMTVLTEDFKGHSLNSSEIRARRPR